MFPFISVNKTGQTVTTTISTSTGNTVPTSTDGLKPRYVRFASTGNCFVRIGIGAQTAVNTDMLVTAASPQIVALSGCTHWAAIDDGVSVKVNVTPLEDS